MFFLCQIFYVKFVSATHENKVAPALLTFLCVKWLSKPLSSSIFILPWNLQIDLPPVFYQSTFFPLILKMWSSKTETVS